ncbi:glycoside hydrolase family 65 protein [Nocardiopsis mangrovi]|uniref:Glycoside hydrolase family 65 protein n=1 Tax=Nocardiopsis mangrovi TaxID=1179818 RepID=A0ABV9DUL7_9ACTN
MSAWTLVYGATDPAREGAREALCTLGNGYFATRGATAESTADAVHYPGTYIAGCYDRAVSTVSGHTVENEDMVNAPNWLPLTFWTGAGEWFTDAEGQATGHRTELAMDEGVLHRTFLACDGEGRETLVHQRRLVSMDDPHVAAIETTFEARNWSGTLTVRSALDGRVANAGVPRYRALAGRHLRAEGSGGDSGDTVWLRSVTEASRVEIVFAARTRVTSGPAPAASAVDAREGWIACDLDVDLVQGRPVTVEKVVALHTSRDNAISDPLTAACATLERTGDFADLLGRHTAAWVHLWRACAVDIGEEHDQRVLNLHVFHLLQTLSPHVGESDAGVPARGLHGEAYRGHVFWDEVFVLPFLSLHFPETARALLRYRWRRLPQARAAARRAGLRGALFPWQSGSDGREEAQRLHLNPRDGRWTPDNSHLQRHVGIAIAYNVWQHYQATDDIAFLSAYGAELLLEIARMFAGLAAYDEATDRYVIRGVMGPDEYHDGYPGREEPGLDDNAYTNIMVVWVLNRALDILRLVPSPRRQELRERLGLDAAEVARFGDIARRMHVPFHDGVISQFAGYGDLAELDWAAYRAAYGDIRRLDRILEAEDDSCNRYRVSKQADVLMLFYLLTDDELSGILHALGYPHSPDLFTRTIAYYLDRTSHGSTLSAVVHAWVLARDDCAASWRFFRDALHSDIEDAQGGTTAEGVHLGAMAGTVDLLTRCYGGLRAYNGVLHLAPSLPGELPHLALGLRYQGHHGVQLRLHGGGVEVAVPPSALPPITVEANGRTVSVPAGGTGRLPSRDAPQRRNGSAH